MKIIVRSVLIALVWAAGAPAARAHAFLQQADPAVGGTVKTAPTEVKIQFSAEVDAGASSIKVFDATDREVDKKDVHTDPKDRRLLVVSLPTLPGVGNYKVVWRAVSLDTHVTTGDFTFRVEP